MKYSRAEQKDNIQLIEYAAYLRKSLIWILAVVCIANSPCNARNKQKQSPTDEAVRVIGGRIGGDKMIRGQGKAVTRDEVITQSRSIADGIMSIPEVRSGGVGSHCGLEMKMKFLMVGFRTAMVQQSPAWANTSRKSRPRGLQSSESYLTGHLPYPVYTKRHSSYSGS